MKRHLILSSILLTGCGLVWEPHYRETRDLPADMEVLATSYYGVKEDGRVVANFNPYQAYEYEHIYLCYEVWLDDDINPETAKARLVVSHLDTEGSELMVDDSGNCGF